MESLINQSNKRLLGGLENRTWVNKQKCVFLIIRCYCVQLSEQYMFTVRVSHKVDFCCLQTDSFEETVDFQMWCPDFTHNARIHCRLTLTRTQGKSSTLSSLTSVLFN